MISLVSLSQISFAQGITIKDVSEAWSRMGAMVVETAKLMPEEHYSFSPIDPLASFGDLVNHTTGANYLFGATVKLEKPSETKEINTSNKQEVIDGLEASFKFIGNGISKLSDQELKEEIEWFGSKMSRLQAILTMTDHLQRQHGKAITYVRLKGVAPARSAGW